MNRGRLDLSDYHGQTKVTKTSIAMQHILQDLWEDIANHDLSVFLTRDH